MVKHIFGLVFMVMMADVSANPFDVTRVDAFRSVEFQLAAENNFLPGKHRSRVGEKTAASRAKQAFPQSKILAVDYMKRKDSYRVKMLSNGGVVKYVFVDPGNGEVYE